MRNIRYKGWPNYLALSSSGFESAMDVAYKDTQFNKYSTHVFCNMVLHDLTYVYQHFMYDDIRDLMYKAKEKINMLSGGMIFYNMLT